MRKKYHLVIPLMHILIWMLYILSPLFFFRERDNVEIIHFVRHTIMAISLMCVFYFNYCFVVKNFFSKDGLRKFAIINICAIAFYCGIGYVCHKKSEPILNKAHLERFEKERKKIEEAIRTGKGTDAKFETKDKKQPQRMTLWNATLNLFACICIIGTAVSIKSIHNLYKTEEKQKEEKRARTEAELKNLKNQLNPHFLFNTLNNIYALIAISQDKSQEAVMDLSKLLRYVLYDSDAREVPISKELDFLKNYVELMRLRFADNVEVKMTTDISQNPHLAIAPLLFITFIENAFKHGVSSCKKSFIHFSIVATDPQTIRCEIANSYFPKSEEQDKSGSGIGLENLKKRLELLYPGKYAYNVETTNEIYKSTLTINGLNNGIQQNS